MGLQHGGGQKAPPQETRSRLRQPGATCRLKYPSSYLSGVLRSYAEISWFSRMTNSSLEALLRHFSMFESNCTVGVGAESLVETHEPPFSSRNETS